MRREEFDAIYAQGPEAVFEVIRRMDDRIEKLERRAGRDSGNSSMPPSSDSPRSRAERRRLAREAYKRSMRKSGGQPGHGGKTRELVAPERVDRRFEHPPERCGCGHIFDGSEPGIGDPFVHQQYELPPIRPLVLEHARLRLECPGCGRAVLAELPGAALSGYGPRIEAHIAMLAGVFRLSRDQVRQAVVEIFGVAASTGAIDNAIRRMSAILRDPWAELRDGEDFGGFAVTDRCGLLEEYEALWTFADIPDLEIDPTNNAAERAVRHAVLMRKLQGGTQSDRGSRWIERIQSVRETCRLQGRSVLDWLTDAATTAHHGTADPLAAARRNHPGPVTLASANTARDSLKGNPASTTTPRERLRPGSLFRDAR